MRAISLDTDCSAFLGDVSTTPATNEAPLIRPEIIDRNTYALAGMPIDAIDLAGTLRRIEEAVSSRARLFISTPNSNFTVAAQSDEDFRRSVQLSDLVVPDGMPLVLFARMLRLPVQGRVTGADLFEQLLVRATQPLTVYFFGGPPGAAATACERVNALGGPVRCVGHATPGFVPVEAMSDDATIDHINACRPDFVVVALGAKKGQAWILRNQHRLDAPVISHLGAVVNFTAGSVRRAPRWVQALGAEWLWRIYQEPVLWRRYWNDGRVMLKMLITEVLPELPGVWLARRAAAGPVDGRLDIWRGTSTWRLALSGNWRGADLGPLRSVLQEAIDHHVPVEVDVRLLSDLDACLTGLVMLAEARLPRLRLVQASTSVRQQLERQGARFLID